MKNNSEYQKIFSEIFEAIHDSEFQKILDSCHFVQMHKNYKQKNGYQDQYFIGYQSNMCRLGFFYEPGGDIGVGFSEHKSAQENWDDINWIAADYVISFVLQEPITRWVNSTRISRKENIKLKLTTLASKINPISDQIMTMFKDKQTISKWRPALEKYIREDNKRRYNLK